MSVRDTKNLTGGVSSWDCNGKPTLNEDLMERVLSSDNMREAWKRVKANKGVAGVEVDGKTEPTRMGVPQGGPLSPLLSNIVLDVLDKELEKRGHRFVRYADDCVPRRQIGGRSPPLSQAA